MAKLEILVTGIEDEKKQLDLQLRELQKQLDEVDSADIEVVFFIDKGEKTKEERQQVLLNDSKAKFYCFVEAHTIIEHNFIVRKFQAIVNGKTTKHLNDMGVFVKPKPMHIVLDESINKATEQN